MELDRRGAKLLFQVLTEREEKNSVAIESNQSLSGWTDTFTDPRLCAAIIDRLTFNGTIIETETQSYRLAHTRSAAASHPGPGTGRPHSNPMSTPPAAPMITTTHGGSLKDTSSTKQTTASANGAGPVIAVVKTGE